MYADLENLIKILRKKKQTIAFAESITSGMAGNIFAKQFDIGNILLGSIVCYHEIAKQKILSVKKKTLKKFTAESPEVTVEMVKGLKKLLNAEVSISVTGLATEGGSETPEKPVGTVFVAVLYKNKVHKYRSRFFGDRDEIVLQAVHMMFNKALLTIKN
jgi:nicotinamide-nucleotide amidase